MNTSARLHSVAGDFALSAIAIRLLAPDPESLLRYMPDTRPGQTLEEWERFSQGIDWEEEAQSVLYVGNFIHEFVHLLQHTTLFQCMHQVHTFHALFHDTLSTLMECKESDHDDKWPPRIPLLNWIGAVHEKEGERLWKHWILSDLFLRLYEGDEQCAEHYCETVGKPLSEVLIDPFNPTIGRLDHSGTPLTSKFRDLPITTKMLLETQATAFEYRFMGSFYGEPIARQLIGGSPNAPLRPDYDALHLVAITDGMSLLLPVLIDWAFMGQAHVPDGPPYEPADYSAIHPSWRFARLYNAAKQAIVDHRIPQGNEQWSALMDITSLQKTVYRGAGLDIDDIDQVVHWVSELPDSPLKSIFQINLAGRKKHPQAYAMLEANHTPVQSWTCTPLVMFRDKPFVRYHPGKRLDPIDELHLDHFAKRIFEISRMVEGKRPICPFCERVDDGHGKRVVPPVGSQGWGVTSHEVSSNCHCGWAFDFKTTWGLAPEDISYMPEGTQ